jgi:hypothetical protein
MNAKAAKKLRRLAEKYTQHLPELSYHDQKTKRLGECTKGAYKALKNGGVQRVAI